MQWTEPKQYWRSKLQQNFPREHGKQVLYGLGVFVSLAGIRYLSSLMPDQQGKPFSWGSTFLIAFIGALVIAFGYPELSRFLSASHVIISKKGVNNNLQLGGSVRVHFYDWNEISAVVAGQDQGQSVIRLLDADDQVLTTLALSDKVTLNQVQSAVQSSGGNWRSA